MPHLTLDSAKESISIKYAMKKIITLLALISTISFAAILSNGCSKKLTYKGTLKIKILSAGV